jgi:hypothetical protein
MMTRLISICISFFHWTHGPFLIILPLYLQNNKYKIIYIKYAYFILFSYTFTDGECPITYSYKKINNNSYIAGSNITDLADLYLLQIHPYYINIYIRLLSSIYFYHIFRYMYLLKYFNKWTMLDAIILACYLYQLYIYKNSYFTIIQLFCRYKFGHFIFFD